MKTMNKETIEEIPTANLIFGPFDIRTEIGNLTDLKNNIQALGIKVPLMISPNPERPGTFNVLDGNRRLKIAQQIGLKTVPVINCGNMSIEEQFRIAIITGILRKNLSAEDQGKAVRKYKEQNPTKTEETIAMELGLPPKKIRSYLYFANLEPSIKISPPGTRTRNIERDGSIPEHIAYTLARVTSTRFPDNPEKRSSEQIKLLSQTENLPSKIRAAVLENYGNSPRNKTITKIVDETIRNTKHQITANISAELNDAADRFMRDNGKDKQTAIRMLILTGLQCHGYMPK